MNYRNEFPIFENKKDTLFDNAATSQKLNCVIEAQSEYYRHCNGNAGRGSHDLAYEIRANHR